MYGPFPIVRKTHDTVYILLYYIFQNNNYEYSIGEVTIDQCVGGARSVKCMVWETSNLDPDEGIRFRGLTIPECQAVLPTFKGPAGDGEPLLESLMWLLLTSEVPTKEQVDTLTAELHSRAELPAHVKPLLYSLPKDMHPMTQLTIGLAACQTDSKFAKAYASGVPKSEYHVHALEDILSATAQLPEIAAIIYRNVFHDGVVQKDTSLDYSGNFCRMLGYDDPSFDELMRLYLCIHTYVLVIYMIRQALGRVPSFPKLCVYVCVCVY